MPGMVKHEILRGGTECSAVNKGARSEGGTLWQMLLTTWVRPIVWTTMKRAPTVMRPLLAKLKAEKKSSEKTQRAKECTKNCDAFQKHV
jgi:hypothetical protein